MRKLCIIILLALPATLCFQEQTIAETPKPANGAAPSKESATTDKPKPEVALRRMADYLGNLPALACRVEATLEIKAQDQDVQQVTKMTVRLQRPIRLALIVDDGEMGMTVVSDGKQLTQCLPVLKRYVISDVPASFAQMTDIGVPLKINILGSTGSVIPTDGDPYYKNLVAAVTGSENIGTEKVGGVLCHHLRFTQERFDWDIWIEDGKRPVVQKLALDLSKQLAGEHATVRYTVAFSDWNVSPKFKDADFAFTPPAHAEQVDILIEPDPPHPLLGKPAPAFKTVDLDEHPFDLKQHLGKNVILLDFWATTCGPCVMLMPQLDAIAKKYADRGLVYRAVNGGEDTATIKGFLEATKLKVPIVMDPETEISHAYLVDGIPQTVLIGKDGKVQVVHMGYSEDLAGEISKEIEALLAGKDLASEALAKTKKVHKQPK